MAIIDAENISDSTGGQVNSANADPEVFKLGPGTMMTLRSSKIDRSLAEITGSVSQTANLLLDRCQIPAAYASTITVANAYSRYKIRDCYTSYHNQPIADTAWVTG